MLIGSAIMVATLFLTDDAWAQIGTWAATSTVDAPSAREEHTAIWTGSRMIIWGGVGGSCLNTGGVYDPTTDMWTATSTVDAPSPRFGLAQGHLRLHAGGTVPPATSSLDYAAAQTRANNSVVMLGALGDIGVWCAQASGTAHVIIDMTGYFQ
jgi:hypothetical protein